MEKLRLGMIVLAVSGLAFYGCDDDGGGGTDAGPGTDAAGTDSGPGGGGDDAGTDAGPGGGGDTCGPTGGECMINPGAAATACTPDPASGMARGCLLQGGGMNPWTTMCFPVGVVPEGGDCDPMMAGQCGAGFQCLGDPGSATCARHCCSNADCNPGDMCISLSGAGPMGMEAGTCQSPVDCDPLNQTTDGSNMCPMGQGCYPTMGSLGCFGAGMTGEGEECEFLNDCGAGFACVQSTGDTVFRCRQMCNPMDMMTTCPMGTMCNGLNGFTDLGSCAPMMMM